jgi:hypothetical protein
VIPSLDSPTRIVFPNTILASSQPDLSQRSLTIEALQSEAVVNVASISETTGYPESIPKWSDTIYLGRQIQLFINSLPTRSLDMPGSCTDALRQVLDKYGLPVTTRQTNQTANSFLPSCVFDEPGFNKAAKKFTKEFQYFKNKSKSRSRSKSNTPDELSGDPTLRNKEPLRNLNSARQPEDNVETARENTATDLANTHVPGEFPNDVASPERNTSVEVSFGRPSASPSTNMAKAQGDGVTNLSINQMDELANRVFTCRPLCHHLPLAHPAISLPYRLRTTLSIGDQMTSVSLIPIMTQQQVPATLPSPDLICTYEMCTYLYLE